MCEQVGGGCFRFAEDSPFATAANVLRVCVPQGIRGEKTELWYNKDLNIICLRACKWGSGGWVGACDWRGIYKVENMLMEADLNDCLRMHVRTNAWLWIYNHSQVVCWGNRVFFFYHSLANLSNICVKFKPEVNLRVGCLRRVRWVCITLCSCPLWSVASEEGDGTGKICRPFHHKKKIPQKGETLALVFDFTWRKVNVQIERWKHICQICFDVANIELMVVHLKVIWIDEHTKKLFRCQVVQCQADYLFGFGFVISTMLWYIVCTRKLSKDIPLRWKPGY